MLQSFLHRPGVGAIWTQLVRRARRPNAEAVIAGCLGSYGFLRNLSTDEAELARDPHRQRKYLRDRIVQGSRR